MQARAELVECLRGVAGEDVLDDADLGVVMKRHVDVLMRDKVDRDPGAGGTEDGEADGGVGRARSEQAEERREHGPRPLLRVAEKGPGPLSGLDSADREVDELRIERLEPGGHQVQKCGALVQPERRPIEFVVGDETDVIFAAAAGETDAEQGRADRARQSVDLPEGGQAHARLAPGRAGERVPGRQRVVHVAVVIDSGRDCVKHHVGNTEPVAVAGSDPAGPITRDLEIDTRLASRLSAAFQAEGRGVRFPPLASGQGP